MIPFPACGNLPRCSLQSYKGKGSFYIAQYPVRWTAQSALHFLPSLTDLFIPTPFTASPGSILSLGKTRRSSRLKPRNDSLPRCKPNTPAALSNRMLNRETVKASGNNLRWQSAFLLFCSLSIGCWSLLLLQLYPTLWRQCVAVSTFMVHGQTDGMCSQCHSWFLWTQNEYPQQSLMPFPKGPIPTTFQNCHWLHIPYIWHVSSFCRLVGTRIFVYKYFTNMLLWVWCWIHRTSTLVSSIAKRCLAILKYRLIDRILKVPTIIGSPSNAALNSWSMCLQMVSFPTMDNQPGEHKRIWVIPALRAWHLHTQFDILASVSGILFLYYSFWVCMVLIWCLRYNIEHYLKLNINKW